MSYVTGVVLQLGCGPDEDKIPEINKWLSNCKGEFGFGPLVEVCDHAGGTKHPQVMVYVAGYNYFPEEAFRDYILSTQWADPSQVVLLMTTELNPTEVHRPKEPEGGWER